MKEKTVTTSPSATVTASFDDKGEMFISGVSDTDRLLKKAEQEDGCQISVGGLVIELERVRWITSAGNLLSLLRAKDTLPPETNRLIDALLEARERL